MLKLYPLTPGQVDAIAATETLSHLNTNALPVAIASERRVHTGRLRAALDAMQAAHPSLRMRLVEHGPILHTKQAIAEHAALLVDECDTTDEGVPEAIAACFAEIAAALDLTDGPTWGVTLLHSRSLDYLVFGFSHFVADASSMVLLLRSFERAYRGEQSPDRPDTYLDYLASLAGDGREALAATQWWTNRPWADIAAMEGVDPARIGAFDLAQQGFVTTARWNDGMDPYAVERDILVALSQAIAEQSPMEFIRLDVCRHGRYDRIRRNAVGWLSQVVPNIIELPAGRFDAETCRAQLQVVEGRGRDWDVALEHLRMAPDVPVVLRQGAHAYVNFHGSFDPGGRSLGQFTYAASQPGTTAPLRRRSFTPLRVLVRRFDQELRFTWRFSECFFDLDAPYTVAKRAMFLLDQW